LLFGIIRILLEQLYSFENIVRNLNVVVNLILILIITRGNNCIKSDETYNPQLIIQYFKFTNFSSGIESFSHTSFLIFDQFS